LGGNAGENTEETLGEDRGSHLRSHITEEFTRGCGGDKKTELSGGQRKI